MFTHLLKKLASISPLAGITTLSLFTNTIAFAFPVNPSKVPVTGIEMSELERAYTLAYDSDDKSVVYYAPKEGRIALMNGMPLLGFGTMSDGRGVLNAQFEFTIAKSDRMKLLNTVRKAGYTPVPFPYLRTKVKPLFQGWDPDTGKRVCVPVTDVSTGDTTEDCDPTLFEAATYVKTGPTLGENIAVSALLTNTGAALFGSQLRGGNAVQVALEAEYYAAGDAFTAIVEVNYEKLYEAASTYAGYKTFFASADMEGFWKREGLCVGKPANECSVRITYFDGRGRRIENVSVDPDSADARLVLQAVDRLRDRLQDELFQPITPVLGKVNSDSPKFGWKVAAKFESSHMEMHARFEFKSPRGINIEKTTIVASAACINVAANGVVRRETAGDCALYWDGTIGFDQLMERNAAK